MMEVNEIMVRIEFCLLEVSPHVRLKVIVCLMASLVNVIGDLQNGLALFFRTWYN